MTASWVECYCVIQETTKPAKDFNENYFVRKNSILTFPDRNIYMFANTNSDGRLKNFIIPIEQSGIIQITLISDKNKIEFNNNEIC